MVLIVSGHSSIGNGGSSAFFFCARFLPTFLPTFLRSFFFAHIFALIFSHEFSHEFCEHILNSLVCRVVQSWPLQMAQCALGLGGVQAAIFLRSKNNR